MQKLTQIDDLFKRFLDINKEEALDENISLKVISINYNDLFTYFKEGKYPYEETQLINDFLNYLKMNDYKVNDCKELNKIYINLIEIDEFKFSSIVNKCIHQDQLLLKESNRKKRMNIMMISLSVIFFILLFTVLF